MIAKIIKFIQNDVWRIPLENLPPNKSFFIRQLRVVLSAIKGFNEDRCILQASALTFYCLLSIVPVLAMLFGIAQGFGMEEKLDEQLVILFGEYENILEQVRGYASSLLQNTKGGLIAGVGIVMLIWSVMKVLGNIEESFNIIWEVKKPRSILRKFTDYLSILLIAPVLLIVSGSLTVFISTQVANITEKIEFLGYLSPVIFFLLRLIPYVLLWIVFALIYIILPNTKVRFKSGMAAGIIAGTMFNITQWAFVTFEVGVANYNAIYGSFAALPLFLFFMQTAWFIVLFGAELSFAEQNIEKYEFEMESKEASRSFRDLATLMIVQLVVKNFEKGELPVSENQIAKTLKIPIRLTKQIVYELVQSRIFSEVKTEFEKESAFQPAIDINKITIHFVLKQTKALGISDIPIVQNNSLKRLKETFNHFETMLDQSKENILIKDL